MRQDLQTRSQKNTRAAWQIKSSWRAAYGRPFAEKIGSKREAHFISPEFSYFACQPARAGEYHVFGDIWLSNKAHLIRQFDLQAESSDADVTARLWQMQQEESLMHMQGSYAFIVFDEQNGKLKAVRDAVGASTMYILAESASYLFSARLSDLRAHCSGQLNLAALRDYLSCAFVPGEQTLLKGIRELRPGEIFTVPPGEQRFYWTIKEEYQALDNENLDWHAGRLRERLEEVLREYLPENEELGCYLSGGLDSSTVAAMAGSMHNKKVHCFSIHFGNECPNELEFSKLVAAHCRTEHHIIEISPRTMWDRHREVIGILDDPIGDPLTVPNLILGEEARRFTSVILNGEGGDPCFGGPKNQPMMLETLYGSRQSMSLSRSYLASFQKCANDLPRLLRPEIWNEVKDSPSVFENDLNSKGHYVNKFLLINTKYKGADHILTKVNNITQALEISGRSPLFDRRIVETSLTIPPQHKLKGAIEKAVLKAAVRDLLPERIIERPKSGMMVPVQHWYRNYWHKQAKQLLLAKHAHIGDYLNQDLVKNWLNYQGDTWGRYGVKLWLLCSLEHWLDHNMT